MSKKNIRDLLREVLREEYEDVGGQVGTDEQVGAEAVEQKVVATPKKKVAPAPPPKADVSEKEEEEEEVVIETPRRRPAREVQAQPAVETPAPPPPPPLPPQALQVLDILKLLDDPDVSDEERKAMLNVAWKKLGPRREFLKYMDLLSRERVVELLQQIAAAPQSEIEKILAEKLLALLAHGGVR